MGRGGTELGRAVPLRGTDTWARRAGERPRGRGVRVNAHVGRGVRVNAHVGAACACGVDSNVVAWRRGCGGMASGTAAPGLSRDRTDCGRRGAQRRG